jgi:hypothetical protein
LSCAIDFFILIDGLRYIDGELCGSVWMRGGDWVQRMGVLGADDCDGLGGFEGD